MLEQLAMAAEQKVRRAFHHFGSGDIRNKAKIRRLDNPQQLLNAMIKERTILETTDMQLWPRSQLVTLARRVKVSSEFLKSPDLAWMVAMVLVRDFDGLWSFTPDRHVKVASA